MKYKSNFVQLSRSIFNIPKFMELSTQAKWLYVCLTELEHKYTEGVKKNESFFHADSDVSVMSGIPLRSFKRCKKELLENVFVLISKTKTPTGKIITVYRISEKIHFDDYREYLNGEHWKGKAKRKRASVGNRCEKCGKKGKISVHHKTYENLHHEALTDLLAVCDDCHKAIHHLT